MIDNSIVKRLAEQLGFDALDVPILSVFSQAVIEDYKAGLVPESQPKQPKYLYVFCDNKGGQILRTHTGKNSHETYIGKIEVLDD